MLTSHANEIERLLQRLESLNVSLRKHEDMASKAERPLSESFRHHLAELREEHALTQSHIAKERLRQALAWKDVDSGPLELADELGRRIDGLLSGR